MGIASLFRNLEFYSRKVKPFGHVSEQSVARYAVAAERQYGRQTTAKVQLGLAGVSPLFYAPYMALAEKAASIKKRYIGATRDAELERQVQLFVSRGLNEAQARQIVSGAY